MTRAEKAVLNAAVKWARAVRGADRAYTYWPFNNNRYAAACDRSEAARLATYTLARALLTEQERGKKGREK